MRENIVFDYLLANAWSLPLYRVSVSEDGFVQCQENRENTQGLQLEKAEVDKIKSIVSEHAHILDYDSKELESPDVFVNCTPFVRQYGILFRKWGVFVCQRDNESTTELKR